MLAPCVWMEQWSGTGEKFSFIIPKVFVQIRDCAIVVINIILSCFIIIVIIIYFMFFFYKATTWYLPSQYAWSPYNMQHFSPTLTRTRKSARDLSLSRSFQVFFFLILTTMKSVLPLRICPAAQVPHTLVLPLGPIVTLPHPTLSPCSH